MKTWAMAAASVAIIAIILGALVIQRMPGGDREPNTTATVTENAVELAISIEKRGYRSGENVDVAFLLKNGRNGEVKLIFSDSQIFDLVMYDENLAKVCAWSDDKAFLEVVTEIALNPGESRSQLLTWGQRKYDRDTSEYLPIKPGKYYLEGLLMGGWFDNQEAGPKRQGMRTPMLEIVILP
ncbi:MAG: BsuPI-related putative proteinase inhibitor [Candidatus Hodarchaeaceae archaeon]|nr:BsuPI-related putative proteinase inhibitor [Candidatus Hodarchaeaceae archaeon]